MRISSEFHGGKRLFGQLSSQILHENGAEILFGGDSATFWGVFYVFECMPYMAIFLCHAFQHCLLFESLMDPNYIFQRAGKNDSSFPTPEERSSS